IGDGAVDVVFELGQLAGAGHDFAPYQKWRLDFDVTVLARVEVEHEVDQPAGKPRTGTHQDRKSRASELRAPREVEDAKLLRDLPVRFAAFWRGRAPAPQRRLLVRNFGQRRIRHE